jgi:hypothetical protein
LEIIGALGERPKAKVEIGGTVSALSEVLVLVFVFDFQLSAFNLTIQ